MGYVAVTGGEQAIAASLDLNELRRVEAGRSVAVEDILATMPDLVNQVQSEGSLWAPKIAAVAIKQACPKANFPSHAPPGRRVATMNQRSACRIE